MIHFDPMKQTKPGEGHLISINSEPDGLHIAMTDNVAAVIQYPRGDVKIVSKQSTKRKPFWTLSGFDGYMSLVNTFTGEREEFNTSHTWLEAAKSAGIKVQHAAAEITGTLEDAVSDILDQHPEHNTNQEHKAVLTQIMQAIKKEMKKTTIQEEQ